jgi:(2R)-sulfolactate sulfo-lyase subunit beta
MSNPKRTIWGYRRENGRVGIRNPRTVRMMSEHIDVDISGILRREMSIGQAGDALIDSIVRTANGRFTAAEALGHVEFVMTKLYRSA